jgi:hypothetical protein
MAGRATHNELPPARVPIAAHHQQISAEVLCTGEQSFANTNTPSRLYLLGALTFDAVPCM